MDKWCKKIVFLMPICFLGCAQPAKESGVDLVPSNYAVTVQENSHIHSSHTDDPLYYYYDEFQQLQFN